MNKLYLRWEKVYELLKGLDLDSEIVYGVPNGGMIAAGFLNSRTTCYPEQATVILDDLIDSGGTREHYQKHYPNARFVCLIEKENTKHTHNKWIVFPWEKDHPKGEMTVEENIVRQLQYIGEDVTRDGLKGTPARIVKSWDELYAGYKQNPGDIFTVFEDKYDEIVLLKNIEMYSMCEHHMLPFHGLAHIAYIANGKVIGISKLARLLDIFARRLQIQERIGQQVTAALDEYLKPLGSACIIEAKHMCMTCRGVNKQHASMVTSTLTGRFRSDVSARNELMTLIK